MLLSPRNFVGAEWQCTPPAFERTAWHGSEPPAARRRRPRRERRPSQGRPAADHPLRRRPSSRSRVGRRSIRTRLEEILREVGSDSPGAARHLRARRASSTPPTSVRACRASASTRSASAATSRSRSASSRARCRASRRCGCPPGVQRLAEEHRGLVPRHRRHRRRERRRRSRRCSGTSTARGGSTSSRSRTRSRSCTPTPSCIVNQREVGLDTGSFHEALRRVLRQDPDVILIGELRDAETAETALQAAESGHLVLSTMHTVDAAETVGRLVEFFPAIKQPQVRSILAGVLKGVVSQRLLPRANGGRVAAVEVMISERPHRRADPREQGRSSSPRRSPTARSSEMQTLSQRADRPRHQRRRRPTRRRRTPRRTATTS